MRNLKNEHSGIPVLDNIDQVSAGWINKYILTYKMPDGRLYEYEAASRKNLDAFRTALEGNAEGRPAQPDAVCIVPILPDDSVLMIREFRYPLNAWCIAFPAGLMEPGESIEECVARELREETGCELIDGPEDDAIYALPQSGYSSTGLTDENVQVVFAKARKAGKSQPEPSEFIEPFTLKLDQIGSFLQTNTDLIGTRAQLVLEMLLWKQRSR